LTKHPFINIHEAKDQSFHTTPPPPVPMLVGLVANAATSPGVPLIRIDRVNPQQGFATLNEAEDFVLAHFAANSTSAVTENLSAGALPFVIQRACSKIAQRTRRGMANRVLVHPEDLKQFVHNCTGDRGSMFMAVPDGAQLGRCTHVGMLNNALDVWTHPSVPRGSYMVLYNARLDGAAAAVQTHTGWHLAMMPAGNMAEAKDYAILVR
jgi:hypothetical protein